MAPIRNWKLLIGCSLIALSAAMVGCSSTSDELRELRMAKMQEEQREQERLDRQRLAGIEGGLARNPERFNWELYTEVPLLSEIRG